MFGLKNLFSRKPVETNAALIPSQLRPAQIEQFIRDGNQLDISQYGYGVGNAVVGYGNTALIRCISLASSLMAQLITQGGLRVVDQTGKRVKTRKVVRLMDLLMTSPDDRLSAYTFFEAIASDQLYQGNSLVRVVRGANGPVALRRQSVFDATTNITRNGLDYTYQSRNWDQPYERIVETPRRDMVHSVWGSLLPSSNSSTRTHFAIPVVSILRRATEVAAEGEQYVLEYFKSASAMSPYAIKKKGQHTKEQLEEAQQRINQKKGRNPLLIANDMDIMELNTKAQDSETKELRLFQIEEIARVFGIPGPLVGVLSASAWGSGIAELGKYAYRFGVQQHTQRLLAAFSHKLLEKGQRFEVDPISIVRSDPAALAGLIATGLGGPNNPAIITREEGRNWLGLPRDPDGEYPEFNPKGTPTETSSDVSPSDNNGNDNED